MLPGNGVPGAVADDDLRAVVHLRSAVSSAAVSAMVEVEWLYALSVQRKKNLRLAVVKRRELGNVYGGEPALFLLFVVFISGLR